MNSIKLQQIDQLIKKYCSKEWNELLQERASESSHKAHSILFREGDKVENISIVKSGKIKIYSSNKNNSERIYRFATEGQIIGHRCFGKEFILPVNAFALTRTTVLDIPLSLFKSLLKANSLFCYYFMMFFAEELKESERYIKDISSMDLRQRVAQSLLINANAFGFKEPDNEKLAFTLSRKDISYLANTTYESVIRTLSQFQKEGIIKLVNKDIYIKNLKKLKTIKLHG